MSDGVEEQRWSPPAALVALAWLGAAGAAVWLVLLILAHADATGRLVAGVAALGLLVAALFGTVARPRLAADPGGVTVRGLFGPRRYPWSRVEGIRVLRTRRLGRDTSLVELDVLDEGGAERLLLFGRLDLGEDPEDVAGQLDSRRMR
ncbi:PH domain-containing protein [Pseudonocardia acidicola]|uniref:PH domain-containing protein n=1 Tax=Pseudonocardia acidicola TaxID=2724939 RepID=A0ABX1SG40_9PSEU|nr:PH domain-containing protein [Pseudonocardia acidicola]